MTEPPADAAFEALLAHRGSHVLVVVDEGLRVVRAGAEAAALAERDAGDLTGRSVIAAFGSAPLDALAREARDTGSASGEAALGRLGDRQFAVDAQALAGGGVILSMHDITALRRMERVRRDFVANISHELRTPLTSVKLLAETMTSGTVDDVATMRELAVQVERESDRLAQLVDELLDLSMIESGEARLAISSVDPGAVVADTVARIAPVAQRQEVRVVIAEAPGPRVHVLADPARLGQALLNLAHNAVKFSHRGGEVRIGWDAHDEWVRFSVADDGVGVPDAHQPRIFERFYKVDRSRARGTDHTEGGSAGLGLSIVRHIAEAHGGAVGMASEEGVGSTFWIEVPTDPAPSPISG
jgi:two-component system phosphate regulon sensor histidine kinase PhoR